MQVTAKGTPVAPQPRVTTGTSSSAGTRGAHAHSSIRPENRKAPAADARAILRGELIYRGGRHVASVRGGELRRNFDGSRELLRGSLLFHDDVLAIARGLGVRWIVATERESGQVYRIGLGDFWRQSWPYTHLIFGDQHGADLGRFERVREGVPDVVQGALW